MKTSNFELKKLYNQPNTLLPPNKG